MKRILLLAGLIILFSCTKTDNLTKTSSSNNSLAARKWTVDNSFSTKDTFVSCIVKQVDGKILLATHDDIRRINKNGSDDNNFKKVSISGGEVNCMIILANNKILIGGSFTKINGVTRNGLARLNSGGNVDNSFIVDIADGGIVNAIALQSTGKILVGGHFSSSSSGRSHLVRLTANGAIDESFVNNYIAGSFPTVNADVLGITVKADDRFYVTGSRLGFYNKRQQDNIQRLLKNGGTDTSFYYNQGALDRGNGYNFIGLFTAVELPSKNIITGGNFSAIDTFTQSGSTQLYYYGPLLWLGNGGRVNFDKKYSSTNGYIKNIVLVDNDNFFISGGVPVCSLIKNAGVVDNSYNLTFPKGRGTDLIRISADTILVSGRLVFSDVINPAPPTKGVVRIIQK